MPTINLIVQDANQSVISRIFPEVNPALTYNLEWDKSGEKFYETGIDRGVLYMSDGTAVPWNGLTSIVESSNRDIASYFYDGAKISTIVSNGDYSGTMKAFTFPDEFIEIEGVGQLMDGIYLGEQPAQSFNLSYRTLVGNDIEGIAAGYKIHVLFNVMAIPKDTTYASITDSPSPVEFEWDISAVQEEVDGHTPTSHIIIDSTDLSLAFLQRVETVLYGEDDTLPSLGSLSDFVHFLQLLSASIGTTLIFIVDNGNGTWTASTDQSDLIVVNSDGTFVIRDANATIDGDSYDISNTIDN